MPLHGFNFTTPYGVRWNKVHAGIDLAAPEGTPYNAIHAGVVTKAGWCGGYGNCVIVQHGDGTESIYGHASKLLVQVGQKVRRATSSAWSATPATPTGPTYIWSCMSTGHRSTRSRTCGTGEWTSSYKSRQFTVG